MRCCVQNCYNDDLKKTNKSNEITFHRLPKDPVQYAAWLKILSESGCRLSKYLVICSNHFKPEDFDETRPNQRRVKNGAVPNVKTPVDQEAFEVCRVCLALDVKMYEMKNFKLTRMFESITGILVDSLDPGLKAAAAFKEKALLSDGLLENIVHLNKCEIASLKENYNSLKSPLLHIHIPSSLTNIESEVIVSENTKTEILTNKDIDLKERETNIGLNEEEKETEFQENEPWIYVPMKTELESDPIGDNDFNIKDRTDCEHEIRNNDKQMDNGITNVKIDSQVILIENIEQKPRLGDQINIDEESSSKEDTHSKADEEPIKQVKMELISNVGIPNKIYRITDRIKEKIIEMKNNGVAVRTIANETGLSVTSIDCWWARYRKNTNQRYKKSDQSNIEQNYQYRPSEPGKEIGACSDVVRQRLYEAGFQHILMKKPERNPSTVQIVSERKSLHDDLKQRIIALKQEGITNSRIAYLLDTSRRTVRKWWSRWCEEGHMQNHKGTGRKRKTTPEEDQLLIQRVMQEKKVHTRSLASELGISPECLRRRLKGAGFKHMERKAYVPLKAGRSHKVDEELKQQIISMKLNGVSVTDIANQFRVPRTTIYQWWQRWCKENNIKVTNDNNTSTSTKVQGSTEQAHVEKNLQAPTIISSQKSLWQKLPDTECASQNS